MSRRISGTPCPILRAGIVVLLMLTSCQLRAHESLERNIEALTAQITDTPARADLHLRRGELHRLHRDWGAAEADFRRGDTLDAAGSLLDVRLGRLYFEAGRPAEALPLLSRHLDRRADDHVARLVRARALVALGSPMEAALDYALGIAQRPKPELYLEWAGVLADAGRPDMALEALDTGIHTLGPIVSLELRAIELELAIDEVDEALRRLDAINERAPRKERWLAHRGEILERSKRHAAAHRAYTAAWEAVAALPATLRNTAATRDLEDNIRSALKRLARAGRASAAGP